MAEQPTPSAVAAGPGVPLPAGVLVGEPDRPDPLAVQVAGAVQRLRREAGLSERVAARRLGTSQTQLRRMEDPRYLPSLRSLARVAAVYGYRLSVEFAPAASEKPRQSTAPGTARRRPAAKPAPPRVTAPAKVAAPRAGRSRAVRKGRGTRG